MKTGVGEGMEGTLELWQIVRTLKSRLMHVPGNINKLLKG